MSNDQHDAEGKFASSPEIRERMLRLYQDQQNLPVTGKMDEGTKATLTAANEPAEIVTSAKLDEDTKDFFRRAIG
jgi:hypothetical protein